MDEATLERVRSLPHVRTAEMHAGMLRVQCASGAHNLSDVLGVLAEAGRSYGRVLSEPPTLNDVFLEITGRALRDDA
jgi:ABC-2 type transport system ATP-binding protein